MDKLLSKLAVLHQTNLFKELTLDVLQEIAYRICSKKMTKGDVIFNIGETPNGFYIISSGEISLTGKNAKVILLKEGDSCCESDFLSNQSCLFTAVCESNGSFLFLNNEAFNSLIISYPEILSRVIHQVIYDLEKKDEPERLIKSHHLYESARAKAEKIIPKIRHDQLLEHKEIFEALREAPLFTGLTDEDLIPIAKVTQWKEAKRGEVVFSKDDKSDYMYIIFTGSIFIKKGNKEISLLNGHDFFGEAGIVTSQPRMASAVAVEDSTLLKISKESFKTIISTYPSIARSILFKIMSYHYPNYHLQNQDTLLQIEKLLPKPDHTLDPQLFFESLGLSKSKALTVLDLYQTLKSDPIYYIDKTGLHENKALDENLLVRALEECPTFSTPPPHVEIEGIWSPDTEKLIISSKLLEIPIVDATEDSLAYYGAELLNTEDGFKISQEGFPIWNILIGEEYLNNFIMTEKGGGISLECQMDKPHFHMPANKEAHGYYILGKKIQNRYRLSAFKIHFGQAVYTYPGVIHCDAGLQGNWLIGCVNANNSSSAVIRTENDKIIPIHFISASLAQKNIFISIYPK